MVKDKNNVPAELLIFGSRSAAQDLQYGFEEWNLADAMDGVTRHPSAQKGRSKAVQQLFFLVGYVEERL